MNVHDCFEILAASGEIITRTPLQARFLKQQWIAQSDAVIAPAVRISHWQNRVQKWFDQLPERPRLLSKHSVKKIWHNIIAKDCLEPLEARALTGLALRADRWLIDYQQTFQANALYSDDEHSFMRWREIYQTTLTQNQWLDPTRIIPWLIDAQTDHGVTYTPLIALWGFEDLSPLEQAFVDHLTQNGCTVKKLSRWEVPAQQHHLLLHTDSEELAAMTHWLTECHKRPGDGLIMVLDEKLYEHQSELIRLLGSSLLHTQPSAEEWDRAPVFIEGALPLSQSMVVADALAVLGMAKRTISIRDIQRVLSSPYLKRDPLAQREAHRLSAELWRLPVLEMSHEYWRRWLGSQSGSASVLLQTLNRVDELQKSWDHADASIWSARFYELLRTLAWPRGRELSVTEYSEAQALERVLEDFSQAAVVLPQLSLPEALSEIQQLIADTALNLGSAQAPIHIVSHFEDPGIPLKGLWVMGLRADEFPRPIRSIPFIPKLMSSRSDCAGVGPSQNQREAKRLRAAWQLSASQVIYSASLSNGKAEFSPVEWLQRDFAPLMQTNSEPFNESATVVPLPMEHRVESPLAALAMGTPINGGVTLIETQASCPFKAALTFRLKPQIWQEAEYGVSALDRGNWLHAALESFYKAYPRKTAIDSLGEAELAEKVDTCLSETTPRTFQALDLGPLVRLERQWLSSKMTSFIKQDVQRSWTEVTAVEQSSEATIASYPFKIRVDRIDRLAGEDERFVLLDYKSGHHKYPGFIKSPPSDVQLPTYVYYSRLDSANVAGLSLVFVTESAKHRYSHLGNIGLSHAVSDMQVAEALKDTKTAIEGWVTDFTQGLAPATPSKEACSHCQYELICRLKHAKMTHEDDSVQETSDE